MSTKSRITRVGARAAKAWLLVLPLAAYLALALHTSAVEAHVMVAPTAPAPELVDTPAIAGDALPAPLAPCCREHTCSSLSAVGLLAANARDRLPEPRHPHPGIVAGIAWTGAGAATAAPVPPSLSPQQTSPPVYLVTSRLRL